MRQLLSAVLVFFNWFFLGVAGKKFAVEVDEREEPSWAFFLETTAVAVVMQDVPDLQQLS